MELSNNAGAMDVAPSPGVSRRRFFGLAGGLAGLGILATLDSCKKDDNNNTGTGIDLGSGDTGVLNYAFALEQLEAAFYTRVVSTPYNSISGQELSYLTDVRDHEIAHREFFRQALGSSAIQDLTPDFSSIDFTSRASVLNAARSFEDLGVSAYNGAGKLLSNPANLTMAGKIVSVEARHAAIIRDLIQAGTFASPDILDANRKDFARTPSEVLAIAGTFIKEKLNAGNLPTS